jgi:Tol biopolymer transport system component
MNKDDHQRATSSKRRLEMRRQLVLTVLALALLVGAGASAANDGYGFTAECDPADRPCFRLASTIAFPSTRHEPTAAPQLAAEIYLMNPDGTDVRRLTNNDWGDAMANLSPDGKKIVFDSAQITHVINNMDLFVMNADGSEQTHLTRGSSATWSPDSKSIAFHASASGTGTPIRPDPGSATTDSDIFVANIDDLLAGTDPPRNLTNSQTMIDDDADWSPDGHSIVYTAHPVTDHPIFSNQAEIFVINADGTGTPIKLTGNNEEERGPAWSPDGTRIAYACRIGGGTATFELCVMNADGSERQRLTNNSVPDFTPTWSPGGDQIVFHRTVAGQGQQLFIMSPMLNADGTLPTPTQLTFPPGINLLANWGELRVKG